MTEVTGPTKPCGVCHLQSAKYICPRCNALYCSLDCYKRHSERCTEGFYRDSATAELKSITATDGDKRQMLEILQKLHDQQLEEDVHSSGSSSDKEDEDESGGLSQQTAQQLLRKLEAGEEISAADLTPAELQAFHRAVAAGEVAGAVEPWKPWWLTEEAAQLELGEGGTSLVAPLAEIAEEEETGPSLSASSALPPPPSRPLPPLHALTKARPSPLLQCHLLDLLYSYCYVLRLYNGDYHTEPGEAADLLFSLSAVLEATAPAAAGGTAGSPGHDAALAAGSPSPATVLLDCISRACSPPAGSRQQQGVAVAVLSDVAAVLRPGRPTVITALMDLSRLLEAARQQLEGGADAAVWQKRSARSKDLKRLQRRLVAAERKLLFFLSWANEQALEVYILLALAAGAELEKHLAASQQQSGGNSEVLLPGGGAAGEAGAQQPQQVAGSQAKPAAAVARPLVEEC